MVGLYSVEMGWKEARSDHIGYWGGWEMTMLGQGTVGCQELWVYWTELQDGIAGLPSH